MQHPHDEHEALSVLRSRIDGTSRCDDRDHRAADLGRLARAVELVRTSPRFPRDFSRDGRNFCLSFRVLGPVLDPLAACVPPANSGILEFQNADPTFGRAFHRHRYLACY